MRNPDRPKPLDRDTLFSTPRTKIADAALNALNQIQSAPANEQLLGLATAFAAMCSRFQVDPHEMYLTGLKVLRNTEHGNKTNLKIDNLKDFAGFIAPEPFSKTAFSEKAF